ncbi:tetratricopeptide repeat protein [Thermocoleostomius sinensis]|uniref:Tetratricopeptide repeat protein n=1 Tax=Thermocoleostomius sinensis A174 TaxID=2016057 RepID=A0A9E8ZFY2_9CYAN|nr:tetratricopeptide repeat protein [Thermocoleostomius sinensis]WAL62398.1 tetratricopeptide repeat protein [Thermocoleostomius sinensis A174]
MNTYSFASQTRRIGLNSRFLKPAVAKACSTIGCVQKHWQARLGEAAKPAKPSTHQPPVQSSLSSAKQRALLRQQALTEAQQGNHTEAIVLFSHLIDCNPTSANDYSNRGLVYFQNGQADAALADYNRAIELNPRLDSAYNNRANYYAAQGQFLEAILDYDVALDLNPVNSRAWINQAITFRELEMYDRAIESLELALCLGKLEGHIYAERGRTHHLQGDWNCAVADYRRALALLPESSTFQKNPSVRLRAQVERWLASLVGSQPDTAD